MVRCINLLNQLSKSFEVTIITHQQKESFEKALDLFPDLKQCRLLSTKSVLQAKDIFSIAPIKIQKAIRYRYWNRTFFGSAEDHFLLIYPVIREFLKKNKVDYIILEALFIVHSTSRVIRRFQPEATIIYNAYNVDSLLAEVAWKNHRISHKEYKFIKRGESRLFKSVDEIFACSDQDARTLNEMNHGKLNTVVVPNGVGINEIVPEKQEGGSSVNLNIMFCGSIDYFPNQEGLKWFCNEVMPLILKKNSLVRLMVVGRGEPDGELQTLLRSESIDYFGMVDSVEKYYAKAAVAIVPLLSGSGTRLKLLEAMGNRKAVISTAIGAEGIEYTDQENILIASDKHEFAEAVLNLLNDKPRADLLSSQAYLLVQKKYDWNVIGKKLQQHLVKR